MQIMIDMPRSKDNGLPQTTSLFDAIHKELPVEEESLAILAL